MQITARNSLDNSVQGTYHYNDDTITGGVLDGTTTVTFEGDSGVLVRSNDGGDLVVDFISDPSTATGTKHTINAGTVLEGRVRKLYSTTTSADLVAFI